MPGVDRRDVEGANDNTRAEVSNMLLRKSSFSLRIVRRAFCEKRFVTYLLFYFTFSFVSHVLSNYI